MYVCIGVGGRHIGHWGEGEERVSARVAGIVCLKIRFVTQYCFEVAGHRTSIVQFLQL